MSSILKYGTAFPKFRIADNTLHPRSGRKSKHAICYVDEDIITLAFQACSSLQPELDKVDAILFATTTPVFNDRYHASFIASLLELPEGIFAIDLGTTARVGTDALILADKLIQSGSYENILIVAANVSFPPIGKEISTPFGHAAVAMLITKGAGLAEITETHSFSSSIAEEFSYKGNQIQYDSRFARTAGFVMNTGIALKKSKIDLARINQIIINSPYAKLVFGQFKKAGIDLDKQLFKDSINNVYGYSGACHGLLLAISAIETSAGSKVLFDYANGTNIICMNSVKNNESILLEENTNLLSSYQDYLQLRKQGKFDSKGYHSHEMFSSEMLQEREKDSLVNLNAYKCKGCGTIYFIKAARCNSCHNTEFFRQRLSKNGIVFSVTSEHYFPATFPPVNMVVIDLDEGGRITVQQTDDKLQNEENALQIGDKVTLVYRKMMENDSKPNYFWKCKKV